MFKISVKGIAAVGGRHLLRINEREEYELLGGKLEREDATLAERVRQEFLEESGVVVEPKEAREPWFYVLGGRPVLIVPMRCDVKSIPNALIDQDGGQLEWVNTDRLGSIPLPAGYLASIRNERPSPMAWECEPVPDYGDDLFSVALVVRGANTEKQYWLDDACDFSHRLKGLGYQDASFVGVKYEGNSELQVVFSIRP